MLSLSLEIPPGSLYLMEESKEMQQDQIVNSIEINGEIIERIQERNRLRNESGILNERIDNLRNKIRALEMQRVIVDSEINAISNHINQLQEKRG